MLIVFEIGFCSGLIVFGNEGLYKLLDYFILIRDFCFMKIVRGLMKYYNFLINWGELK